MASSIKVGDKVTCSAQYTYDGKTHLASFVRTNTYDVISVSGDRVVIGKGKAVTAAVKASTLTVVGGSGNKKDKKTTTKDAKPKKPVNKVTEKKDTSLNSKGIEDALSSMLSKSTSEMLNYNMRLFGIPHQFTKYCDYRAYNDTKKSNSPLSIGRKFIENIMMEAPVVTVVPGKPLYLPGNKDKASTSYALLAAANGSMSSMVADKTVKKNIKNKAEYKRYFDFQQDYINYMRYVNILCGVGAAFLDLDNSGRNTVGLDGKTPFVNYDWKNYRWNANGYSTATGNMMAASKQAVKNWVNTLKTYGGEDVVKAYNKTAKKSNGGIAAFKDKKEDQSVLDTLETLLTQINFVQFYVDVNSGLSESNQNSTTASKLEGMFESGSDLFKEVAFIANSGGVDGTETEKMLAEGVDTLNAKLFSGKSTASSIMSRLTSGVTNVIRGDNMVFPEIYQNSRYEKTYSIAVDLRTPYGNKLSYYINILVPLFHLIALAVPKQSTANSYSSPFLIKAYYPGVFSCNLGIVDSLVIEKNPDGDSWTVDGLPSHVKVTLNIKDLYADLSITPAGDFTLFVSNASLIEYISTCCGINLTTPQLKNRVTAIVSALKQSFSSVPDTVNMSIFGSLENTIASFIGV